MRTIDNFLASYSISIDAELPSESGEVVNFKYGSSTRATSGMDGPLMRIEPPSGPPWFACFAKGYRGGGAVSALVTTPNPDAVCVVSDGAGYWVDTLRRTKDDVRAFPIREVKVVNGLLVFADFAKLAAYGPNGLVWVSEPLVSDRLAIEERTSDEHILVCHGFDARLGADVQVKVDVQTGQVVSK